MCVPKALPDARLASSRHNWPARGQCRTRPAPGSDLNLIAEHAFFLLIQSVARQDASTMSLGISRTSLVGQERPKTSLPPPGIANDRLRTALVVRGLLVEHVAARVGVDLKTVQRWLAG